VEADEQTGPGGEYSADEAACRSPQGMGRGATRTDGREVQWDGQMGMTTQEENDAASIGTRE
jgi:hypothetical protein